ncbi:MAG: DUF3347 domain-containing protein [Alphaproteobacteria bacterium]|nr:DUF3347 domain-containing protein [Alphaproteobacteria bacterium]
MRRALIFALFLTVGCGGEPAPARKDMVIQGGGGGGEKALDAAGQQVETKHVENTGDFDKFAFDCCKSPAATAVVGAYVALAEKLAADDEPASQLAVDGLVKAAETASIDPSLGERPGAIAKAARDLQAKDIATIRAGLDTLSVDVIVLAREQTGGSQKLSSAFCPMAPGHWLQRGGAIRNPYYGAEMLTCGTLENVAEVE